MKAIFKITLIIISSAILLGSCQESDEILVENETNVQFDSTHLTMREDHASRPITLTFDKPAAKHGFIEVSISNFDPSRLLLEPAPDNGRVHLPFSAGQASVKIITKSINNSVDDGHYKFGIRIVSTSEGFIIGKNRSISVDLLDDEGSSQPRSIVNFTSPDSAILETAREGYSVSIQLSAPLISSGSVDISVESTTGIYGSHYRTVPEAVDGKFTLHGSEGSESLSFNVTPIDNAIITGEHKVEFKIVAAHGSLEKGNLLTQRVIILDDELKNKPLGFVTAGGLWRLKKIYEYDQSGRVKNVAVEKSTPAVSSYTETYSYNALGHVETINTYPGFDIRYTWAGSRISRSDIYNNGVIKEYILYDYDVAGNVSGTANYFRQANGEFKLGFLNTFLYQHDHNLYKWQTYIAGNSEDDLKLISTRTYEGYLEKENPFPMVDILPTRKTQNKLPTVYVVEENGVTLRYSFSYKFRSDGLVTKRITTGERTTEICDYLYY